MAERQVKSKQRVADHGEVFTASREVNAMLDLVKPETERIDSRFLEPACGEGAFLTEILRRKLAAVKSRYGKSPYDYERYAVVAVTSIYGVDILADNAAAKYFKDHGITKLRSTKALQAEIQQLTSEQNARYKDYREKQSRVKELETVMNNLENMLGHKKEKRHELIPS